MSDVYCRTCDVESYDTPAILMKVAPKRTAADRRRHTYHNVLNVNSELEILTANANGNETACIDIEHGTLPADSKTCGSFSDSDGCGERATEYELGNDVAASNDEELDNVTIQTAIDMNQMIRVRGKEELPASSTETDNAEFVVDDILDESDADNVEDNVNEAFGKSLKRIPFKTNCDDDHPLAITQIDYSDEPINEVGTNTTNNSNALNANDSNGTLSNAPAKASVFERMHRMCGTLPKPQKMVASLNRVGHSIPTRTTPDGTTIYYFCNLSKRALKGAHCVFLFC